MKQKYIIVVVLLIAILAMAGCEYGMSEEEIETMKIEQTIGRYLDGFAMNDSEMILQVVNLDEDKRDDFKVILDQFLEVLHRGDYTMRIVYEITEIGINQDHAEINLSAVLRIYENGLEAFSVRLFRDKSLHLVKDFSGEWKIDLHQFIPEELLNLEFLF